MRSSREVVNRIKQEVSLRFRIKDIYATQGGLGFVVDETDELERQYEELRKALRPWGIIVSIIVNESMCTIFVINLPKIKGRPIALNKVMLLLTIFTTVISGSMLWGSFIGGGGLLSTQNLFWGALTFAAPLLLILGTHELSHYLMARRHGLAVSLPFFIPSIPPVGTFGAFISIREPLPSRKALVDIGLAGPFGGFLIAIPVLIIGYFLSAVDTSTALQQGITTYFGMPLLLQGLMTLFPLGDNLLMHPTMFAGWLGLFITGINLLPAGQLDGGHVSRAVLGDKATFMGYGVLGLLILLSTIYTGWLIFGLLILMLGVSHPPPLNDVTPLDRKRHIAAAIGLILLVTCFIPIPMEVRENYVSVSIENNDAYEHTIAAGERVNISFTVTNAGNIAAEFNLSLTGLPANWTYALKHVEENVTSNNQPLTLSLDADVSTSILLTIISDTSSNSQSYEIGIHAEGQGVDVNNILQIIVS